MKVTPNTIEIDFKILTVMERDGETKWKAKGILRNKQMVSFLKLTDEEIARNVEKIIKRKARREENGSLTF